jgi:hypothetical protein
MAGTLTDEEVAQRWSRVTDLEVIFRALRGELDVTAAVRVLIGVLDIESHGLLSQLLAAAVAALDEADREGSDGQLPDHHSA